MPIQTRVEDIQVLARVHTFTHTQICSLTGFFCNHHWVV